MLGLIARNIARNSNLARKNFVVPSRGFIHRTFDDIKADGMVKFMPSGTCESRRYLLKKDKMGFSFHWTVVYPNTTMYIHYKHHLEAVMCVKGDCEVELVEPMAVEGTGEVFKVVAGSMYALDQHESHHLRGGEEECHLICVFSPPCTGEEKQGADGSFQLLE